MWKHFFDFVRQVFTLMEETRQNRADIKELRQELRNLSSVVQKLKYELLRFERRLPASLKRDEPQKDSE